MTSTGHKDWHWAQMTSLIIEEGHSVSLGLFKRANSPTILGNLYRPAKKASFKLKTIIWIVSREAGKNKQNISIHINKP
jgi:hypothetical protein